MTVQEKQVLLTCKSHKKLLSIIQKPFQGINSIIYSNGFIQGIVTKYNENILFSKEIAIDTMKIDDIEEGIEKAMKSHIYKPLALHNSNDNELNIDFNEFFRLVYTKQTPIQIILLVLDLIFYYQLSLSISQHLLDAYIKSMHLSLTNLLTPENKKLNIATIFQITLKILQFIEILENFHIKNIENLLSFEYLSLPKLSFSIENPGKSLIFLTNDTIYTIDLLSLDNKHPYTYEPIDIKGVVYPMNTKLLFNIILNLSRNRCISMKYPSFEAYKALAELLARPLYILENEDITQGDLMMETMRGGFWIGVYIKMMDGRFLAKIAEIFKNCENYMRNNRNNEDFVKKINNFTVCVVFQENIDFNEIPAVFKEKFRVLQYFSHNIEAFLENQLYLICEDFTKTKEIMRKLNILSLLMNNSLENQGFLLKSNENIEKAYEIKRKNIEKSYFDDNFKVKLLNYARKLKNKGEIEYILRDSIENLLKNDIDKEMLEILLFFYDEIFEISMKK